MHELLVAYQKRFKQISDANLNLWWSTLMLKFCNQSHYHKLYIFLIGPCYSYGHSYWNAFLLTKLKYIKRYATLSYTFNYLSSCLFSEDGENKVVGLIQLYDLLWQVICPFTTDIVIQNIVYMKLRTVHACCNARMISSWSPSSLLNSSTWLSSSFMRVLSVLSFSNSWLRRLFSFIFLSTSACYKFKTLKEIQVS